MQNTTKKYRRTVKATIERGDDDTFGVYLDLNEKQLNYGVIGDGKTVEEAIADFYACYEDMRKSFERDKEAFEEVKFEFVYDGASFLNPYANLLTPTGLDLLKDINQRQPNRYVTGV
ncbi:MAG: hypothetical protein LBL94_04090 [Prevotellaceae bacterium]|jgi:hypothetical protein|nr:hypothetical protein [Prevotellaceae bacterium]